MTPKERAAMQQALEALEELHYSSGTVVAARKYELATAALREALAEQAEQEPVGVVTKEALDGVVKWEGWVPREGTKLYATPVRTKDLTDDEVWALWEANKNETAIEFYEAVIAAYKEKNRG